VKAKLKEISIGTNESNVYFTEAIQRVFKGEVFEVDPVEDKNKPDLLPEWAEYYRRGDNFFHRSWLTLIKEEKK